MKKAISLPRKILELVKDKKSFNTIDLYQALPKEVKTTVRGRLYDLMNRGLIERIGQDTYKITSEGKDY